MILAHPTFEKMLQIDDEHISILTVEKPGQLSAYIKEILFQSRGGRGEFRLYSGTTELDIKKTVMVISDLFSLNINSRELIAGINDAVRSVMIDQDHYVQSLKMFATIDKYASQIMDDVDGELDYEPVEVSSFVKMISPRLSESSESIVEALIDYISAQTRYTGKRLFMVLNTRSFLDADELDALYRTILYRKMNVVFIESMRGNPSIPNVRETLIDGDLCEIRLS